MTLLCFILYLRLFCISIVFGIRKSRKQERQRVAVRPGNAHFISIRQVSSDAATLRRGTWQYCCMARRRCWWWCCCCIYAIW